MRRKSHPCGVEDEAAAVSAPELSDERVDVLGLVHGVPVTGVLPGEIDDALSVEAMPTAT